MGWGPPDRRRDAGEGVVSNPLGWDGDMRPHDIRTGKVSVSNPLGWDGDHRETAADRAPFVFLIH